MRFDLKSIRTKYGYDTTEFASYAGISKKCYEVYEIEGEIPCKYIYNFWKTLPDFPIPEDFFYYTSMSLDTNMRYHKLRQVDIAQLFDMPQQSISKMLTSEPLPMYEMKDKFIATFDPLITPCVVVYKKNKQSELSVMTELACRGNFISTKRRREYKVLREKTGMSTAEHKRVRMHEKESLLKQYANDF